MFKRKKSELPQQWNHSLVVGYDFYHYTKTFWLHSWLSVMPVHLETGNIHIIALLIKKHGLTLEQGLYLDIE
jgi:hypothetical protein